MKLDPQTIGLLSLVECRENTAAIVQQLQRKDYERVQKVIVGLGGKWTRARKTHVFPVGFDAEAAIDQAIVRGEIVTGPDLGFFPTSVVLAAELAEWACIGNLSRVLEPSAGTGRLVTAALARGAAYVTAIEIDDKRRAQLRVDLAKYFEADRVEIPLASDFMDYRPDNLPDRVLMNPAFCKTGVGRHDHLDHVRRAYHYLASDGILVSVLPAGVKFREDRRHVDFRTWAAKLGGEIEDLPDGAFKEAKTTVSTVRLRLVK